MHLYCACPTTISFIYICVCVCVCVCMYIYLFLSLFSTFIIIVLHVSWKICRFFSSQFDIPWILVRKRSLFIKFNILIAKQNSFLTFYVYCLCRSVISLSSHLVLLWHPHSFIFWCSSICLHFSSDYLLILNKHI